MNFFLGMLPYTINAFKRGILTSLDKSFHTEYVRTVTFMRVFCGGYVFIDNTLIQFGVFYSATKHFGNLEDVVLKPTIQRSQPRSFEPLNSVFL